ILNQKFDYLPDEIVDTNVNLVEIKAHTNAITIYDVLNNCDTIFRFAPSPSGYLHIGHCVPIILNILLKAVSQSSGNKTEFVIRIDDTNPEEDDFSQAIMNTMHKIMGQEYKDYTNYRSSAMAKSIISIIEASIRRGDDNFYVDLSDQETIGKERADRKENNYRNMNNVDQIELLEKMKRFEINHGVIRAKIMMKSNNGNLRDPVMIRYVEYNGIYRLMPTYDLVCPVLDSLDSMASNKVMIALRDGNYFDRMEQYIWIQNALKLKPTCMLTFSRINFSGLLLSKRGIKEFIKNGTIKEWSDPRLMTIDGLMNRGLCLGGLLNFYWLSSHLSVENRPTSQDVVTLFSANDKILSQGEHFIIERM
ncbi:MAG TPA: glutamate--tRNA ligase family protein, partial [Aquella sp.]|nr:glutamate--tRNA ligase family protein [Aquella sp.]